MRQIVNVRTPTGQLPLVRQTAEKLLREGVLSGELDGDLHAADAATVKAAIMASAICDFCSAPGATHHYEVPDFGITVPRAGNYGASVAQSTGGWMGCDACHALIGREDRKGLVQRAMDVMAFPKFSRRAIEEMFGKFWTGLGERSAAVGAMAAVLDYVNDVRPDQPRATLTDRDRRIEASRRAMGLTDAEMRTLLDGKLPVDLAAKLAKFTPWLNGADSEAAIERLASGLQLPVPPGAVPHWQRALDEKLAALKEVAQRIHQLHTKDQSYHFPEDTDLNDRAALTAVVERAQEVRQREFRIMRHAHGLLKAADAYSFSGETTGAILQAMESLPADATLDSLVVPPGGAGWFWFQEPVATPDFGRPHVALLWGWTNGLAEAPKTPHMAFLAYYMTDAGAAEFDMEWGWAPGETVDQLVAKGIGEFRRRYGTDFNEAATEATVRHLTRFFMMACVWFRQEVQVLRAEPQHIERHARKRLMKEHKLDAPPTVRVVALRRAMREEGHAAPERAEGGSTREYRYRWVRQGHVRNQPCGPGRRDRKLIWIDAHIAGPADKPLRTREKVYAVVR